MKNSRLRRLAALGLPLWLVFHFSLASISAANFPISKIVRHAGLAKALLLYQYLSGTGNCFGFFAPGVISQVKVGYEIKRGNEIVQSGILGSENAEVSLRMHNLTQQFWTASLKPEVRRSLAASFAGKLFSQHPQADSVAISIQSFVLPSMAQYREGSRPSWEKNYEGRFNKI